MKALFQNEGFICNSEMKVLFGYQMKDLFQMKANEGNHQLKDLFQMKDLFKMKELFQMKVSFAQACIMKVEFEMRANEGGRGRSQVE